VNGASVTWACRTTGPAPSWPLNTRRSNLLPFGGAHYCACSRQLLATGLREKSEERYRHEGSVQRTKLPCGGSFPFDRANAGEARHATAFIRFFVESLFKAGAPWVVTDPNPANSGAIRAYAIEEIDRRTTISARPS